MTKLVWIKSTSGTYRIKGTKPSPTTYSISKTPNTRLTKSTGWDVRQGINKLEHFEKLTDAKAYVENLEA